MVRSKSETLDRLSAGFIGRIRDGVKYFEVSRAEILRQLESQGSGEWSCAYDVSDDSDQMVTVALRMNVAARHSAVGRCRIALKLEGTGRIDGIDHELVFDGKDGEKHAGWHRHEWDPVAQSADRIKRPLPKFGRRLSEKDAFLIRAFQEMRITVNVSDHGDTKLPFRKN